MVDVENLSDAELRTKLNEYGYPVMPITGTTRKLMVKKLKLLMENKNKVNNDNRRSLGRYSSEEESDTDVRSTRKDKNRRATMAAPLVQPSSSKTGATLRKSLRHNDNNISEVSQASIAKDVLKTTKRTTSTKVVKTVQDEFDTGSDSEPEIIENDYDSSPQVNNSFTYKRESPIRSSFSPSSPFRFQQSASKYSPPKTVTSSSTISSSTFSSSFSNKPVSPSRFTTYSSNTGDSDAALDRLNQIRSRLSLGNTGYERPTYSPPVESNEEKVETPFLSNFTRRLSQLSSANSPKPDYDFKNDIIKEHDTNGAGSYTRSYLGRSTRYRDINRDYYARHDSNIFKNNMVSFGVLGLAILFFLVVGVMYYGMRSNESAIDIADFTPRCIKSDPNAKPRINCVLDDDVQGAINLLKIIKPELNKRAVAFACNDDDAFEKPYMSEPDIINYQHEVSRQDIKAVQQDLQNLEVLIFKNPEWGITIMQTDEKSDTSEENILKNMEQVIHYRPSKAICLVITRPDVPWRCSIYNKLHAVFNSLIIIFGGFFMLYFCNFIYKYYKSYQQCKKEEVFAMVERIVDALQTNSNNEGDNYLVVNHVRDMILPISDRKRLDSTWRQAVRFINENESRIRTEIQSIQGEPFEVWRWLGSPNLNTSSSPRSKTWQGQAFETQSGSVNSLPCSPTPCLKIRGMVDDNDRNFPAIREAVLSKCAHRCRILHCAVDNTSKCVYLKCADQNDAAIAYTNLHGWWYAGHLVTVKYLRLERYMQRFPDSPISGPPYMKSLSPPTDWSS